MAIVKEGYIWYGLNAGIVRYDLYYSATRSSATDSTVAIQFELRSYLKSSSNYFGYNIVNTGLWCNGSNYSIGTIKNSSPSTFNIYTTSQVIYVTTTSSSVSGVRLIMDSPENRAAGGTSGIYDTYPDVNIEVPAYTDPTYTNWVNHWSWGFKNGEGDNDNHTAKHLTDTYFTATYNTYVTWGSSRATTIPNGYYLADTFGSASWAGTWTKYNMGSSLWQPNYACGAEYDYYPYNYAITYTMNGGTNSSSNPSSYTVLYGVTFATPTKTGHTFSRWTISGSTVTGINPGANATFSSVSDMYTKLASRTTGNKTVVANWTANTYTVTLNQQGGSGGTSSVSIVYGTTTGNYPSITLPTKSGYTFGGYYTGTGGSGTQYYNASGGSVRTFSIASNTTWYAYWKVKQYTVAYNANGGTSTPSTQTADYGSAVTLANAISKNNTDTNVTITITYNANGGSGAPGNSTGIAVNTTPYTFNKWALNSTSGTKYSAGASYTIPASNSTMYATWTTGTTTRKSNPSITLSSTIPTRENYIFLGWSTSSSATTATYQPGTAYTFSANTPLYAVWTDWTGIKVKVSGAYKDEDTVYVKVNGTWKEKDTVYMKVNGIWKSV